MGGYPPYKNLDTVIQLIREEKELPIGSSNVEFLEQIEDPSLERYIYFRAIHELKELWLGNTIKIEIEPKFIEEVSSVRL